MSEAVALGVGADDIINGTNALLYKAGDLKGLGELLDHMLCSDEEREDEIADWGAGGGRITRCWLRQRACEDVCLRHSAVEKLASVIAAAHAEARKDNDKHIHLMPGKRSVESCFHVCCVDGEDA